MGGIAANFGTNLLLDRNSSYIVIEADEFDRSFLHLSPEIAVITAMDEDIWISMRIKPICWRLSKHLPDK